MNISFVRTFLEVVAAGTLNRAAVRLNVSQSTVTTRLDALEQQMGQRLLLRGKAGVQLTSPGFKFQRHAEMLVRTWDRARSEISLPAEFDEVCNVGCHLDLWEGIGREWLDYMREQHPRVALSMWSGDRPEIERWLASGLVDVAFLFDARPREVWTVREFHAEHLLLVSSRPRTRGLPASGYLYVDMGEEFRRQHATAWPEHAMPALIFGGVSWALDYLLRHGGAGYFPERAVREHLLGGRLHTVADAPAFTRPVYLAHAPGRRDAWPWFEASVQRLRDSLRTPMATTTRRPRSARGERRGAGVRP